MVPASPLIDSTSVSASGVESHRTTTHRMTMPQKQSVPNVARLLSFHDGLLRAVNAHPVGDVLIPVGATWTVVRVRDRCYPQRCRLIE